MFDPQDTRAYLACLGVDFFPQLLVDGLLHRDSAGQPPEAIGPASAVVNQPSVWPAAFCAAIFEGRARPACCPRHPPDHRSGDNCAKHHHSPRACPPCAPVWKLIGADSRRCGNARLIWLARIASMIVGDSLAALIDEIAGRSGYADDIAKAGCDRDQSGHCGAGESLSGHYIKYLAWTKQRPTKKAANVRAVSAIANALGRNNRRKHPVIIAGFHRFTAGPRGDVDCSAVACLPPGRRF